MSVARRARHRRARSRPRQCRSAARPSSGAGDRGARGAHALRDAELQRKCPDGRHSALFGRRREHHRLALWDVTDPAHPYELGGLASVGRTGRGVHEFAVSQRGDRTYAYLAVPQLGDIRRPRRCAHPRRHRSPPARRNRRLGRPTRRWRAGGHWRAMRASMSRRRSTGVRHQRHDQREDGRVAYVSYWDQGVFLLDVADPSAPLLLGHFSEPASAEGNTPRFARPARQARAGGRRDVRPAVGPAAAGRRPGPHAPRAGGRLRDAQFRRGYAWRAVRVYAAQPAGRRS